MSLIVNTTDTTYSLVVNTTDTSYTFTINQGGSSGGAVQSVNGKTGYVTLNSDEIPEGVSNLYMSAAEQAKLAGINIVEVPFVVVPTTGWSLSGDGLVEFSILNLNIESADNVMIVPDNGFDAIISKAGFQPKTDSGDGFVKIYAKKIPTVNFLVNLIIFKI